MDSNKTMLLADENKAYRQELKQLFQEDFTILEAADAQDLSEILIAVSVDIAVISLSILRAGKQELMGLFISNPLLKGMPVVIILNAQEEANAPLPQVSDASDYIIRFCRHAIVRNRVSNVLAKRDNENCKIRQSVQNEKISEMQKIIDVDQLTGLLTQNAFLQQVSKRLSMDRKTSYYIVYLDIASFKVINELFTMNTGDTILCSSAAYFNTIVGKKGLACHISTDSFALLLPEYLLDIDLLLQGVDAMMHSLAIYRTVSFYAGIYPIDNTYISSGQMLDRAHMAMSYAKLTKVHRYAFYDEKLRSRTQDERLIAKEMEAAMMQKQFFAKFQPIYYIDDTKGEKRIIAAEALLRWEHPQYGFIGPSRFIPVFEKNGFINRIDRFAWECACHFLSRQIEWGLEVVPVSINISYISFNDSSFADYLIRLLRKYDLQPWMLWLEISQQAYSNSPPQLKKILHRLKSCGFSIVVDDFGSNFSPLGILLDLPIDMVKIDLQQLYSDNNETRLNIVLSDLISMLEKLNIQLIASGAESASQSRMLEKMGCHRMQGFYYAHPLTSDEYIDLLDSAALPCAGKPAHCTKQY